MATNLDPHNIIAYRNLSLVYSEMLMQPKNAVDTLEESIKV